MQQENPSCILGGDRMIKYEMKGDFRKLEKYISKLNNIRNGIDFNAYGKRGVEILSSATPKDTGLTAACWYYTIETKGDITSIIFKNANKTVDGTPIAILLQYGHTTRNGGWVKGIDYIDPSIRKAFEDFVLGCVREVNGHG